MKRRVGRIVIYVKLARGIKEECTPSVLDYMITDLMLSVNRVFRIDSKLCFLIFWVVRVLSGWGGVIVHNRGTPQNIGSYTAPAQIVPLTPAVAAADHFNN